MFGDPKWPHPIDEMNDSTLFVQENDVDRKAHPKSVNALAGVDPESLPLL
jgi:hypothetical protein